MARAQFPDEQGGDGEFVRQDSAFRDFVRADRSAAYPATPGRYHLYVSLACPWAHRTIIARRLLGLEEAIGMTVVDPIRDEHGWAFRDGPGHSTDPINGFALLSEAYLTSDPSFTHRVTVPVLWHKDTRRIVNNESADVLRMFNGEFREMTRTDAIDLYPAAHRAAIDEVNEHVYDRVNNGVYRAGFATSQEAHERAVHGLFEELDTLDRHLAKQRYLVGNQMTEADLRLFTTLVRFDAVYVGHFKCNVRRIADYPHLSGYLRDLYQTAGFGETVDFDHIKRHYYVTHPSINPTRIVPVGPDLDLDAPHQRSALA